MSYLIRISRQIPYKGNTWLGMCYEDCDKIVGFNIEASSFDILIQKIFRKISLDKISTISIKNKGQWVIIMPFAGYKDFNTCVAAQKKKGKSDDSAKKICGAIKKKAEGQELSQEEQDLIVANLTEEWLNEML